MMDPCSLESFHRYVGRSPAKRNWWRFPINGRRGGPGGRVFGGLVVLWRRYSKIKGRDIHRNSDMVMECLFVFLLIRCA